MIKYILKENALLFLQYGLVIASTLFSYSIFAIPEMSTNYSLEKTNQSNAPLKNIYLDDHITPQVKQNFIIIPLGCHCGVAWWMRQHNLRDFAFPFDWAITPYQALYNVIDNNFVDYFKKENLVPSCKEYWNDYLYDFFARVYHTQVDGSSGAVLDKRFQMLFTHDFPNHMHSTINQQYENLYEKHSRRAQRFLHATRSGQHIYFIRLHDITKIQTLALYDLLKNKFPTTPFTLIAMGDDKDFREDWNIPHIKNIYISQDTVNLMALGVPFWEKFCSDLIAGRFQQ